jgi:hypothetical protein
MRASNRWTCALLLAALAAAPAQAGDLTGTWKGKFKCTVENGQAKLKKSSKEISAPEPGVSTLEISHPEGPGTGALQIEVDDVLFSGFALPAGGAVRGVGALFDCTDDGDPGDAAEIRTFKWKVSADSVKGSISWRGMLVNDDQEVGSCKGTWKRISREDPVIGPCR